MDDEDRKILKSINFYLGAIANQLAKQNLLKAHEMGIPVVYWDPTVEPWPNQKHGEAVDITQGLKQGIPKEQRKVQD